MASHLLLPLVVRGDARERRERLGHYLWKPGPAKPVWMHAASAGEIEGARPLIQEILSLFPESRIVLTTMTRSGKMRAEQIERVDSHYVPLDFPAAVRRALHTFDPSLLLIVETEIWPNMIREAVKREIPVAIVNGRISRRAAKRMRWAGSLYREALSALTLIGVQDEIDRQRFVEFGAREDRLFVHGNTKMDAPESQPRDPALRREGERWVVFGSVRKGEEKAVLPAVRAALDMSEDVRVVVAPRHPEEAEPYRKAKDIPWRLWSAGAEPGDRAILIDTVGDLLSFYAIADLSFVGGSLSTHGGHNPLEPARFGVPILIGPHIENCAYSAHALLGAGALEIVHEGARLAERVVALLGDPERCRDRGQRGLEAVGRMRGAAGKCVRRLADEGLL